MCTINLKTWLAISVFWVAFMCATTVGKIIYVDADADPGGDGTSWCTAYKYLQDALVDANAAAKPVEIWVAQGTYKPDEDEAGNVTPGDRTERFQLINGVTIQGGYAGCGEPDPNLRDVNDNKTILSGDLNGDDEPNFINNGENGYRVVTGSETDATAILDGFTITSGNANGGGACPTCYDHGGGMFNWSGSPTVVDCNFSGNSAKVGGGGMFNGEYSSPNVTNCTFNQNSCKYGGGGMANDNGSSSHLTDCNFNENWAGNHGGGMANADASPTVTNCTFSGNSAEGTDTKDGGGGMYNHSSSPMVTNCKFTGNLAVEGGGGGMYNYWGSRPTLKNCTFSRNVADSNGAGMCNEGSYPKLTNCTFSSNRAGEAGGAMYNKDYSNPELLMNCIFTGNSAGSGGAIFNDGCSSSTVINCTFSGNQAANYGGAINNAGCCSPKLVNCILWGDSAGQGDEIALRVETGYLPSAITISYSNIEGGPNGVYVDPNCTLNWGEGNIDEDPCFVDPNGTDNDPDTWEDNDYHLRPISPCIDAGDNTAVPLDTADLDNDGNTAEPTPLDLNSFPRFINDLCTIDSGNGMPPIVDMGAYEFLRSDIDSNGSVDFEDYCVIGAHWLETSCGLCGGADLTCDGNVDFYDLKEFTENWLAGVGP